MSTPNDANDVLFAGGGVPPLQWANPQTGQDLPVGTSYEGEITHLGALPQRDINDKSKIALWPDGRTKYVALVTIQTGVRDPQVDEDDGLRTLWVSGKYMTDAVRDAVKQAGGRQLEEGGLIKVTLTGYGQSKMAGGRPPRMFSVTYRKPSPEKRAQIAAQKARQATSGEASDPGTSDPWAQGSQQYDQGGFLPTGPAATPDPWGGVNNSGPVNGGLVGPGSTVQPQYAPSGPVQQVPSTPVPVAGTVTGLTVGGQMDLSGMTPEAKALVEKMYADQQQQGETQ